MTSYPIPEDHSCLRILSTWQPKHFSCSSEDSGVEMDCWFIEGSSDEEEIEAEMVTEEEEEIVSEVYWVSRYMEGYRTGYDHCLCDVRHLERENQELTQQLANVKRSFARRREEVKYCIPKMLVLGLSFLKFDLTMSG
ncbi:hypothetical protein HOLleu_09785 [Holothuria leucospilota]|uniref:Uncharacterized protein n=1 Tax=Holothuria leucospilota TaxID=206669 RepID=A0A9Q1CC22_HOLLE|nr:hypothetical protein HOLleu_09785 [Holothuria leucospilota]